jgi:hypothetical protein
METLEMSNQRVGQLRRIAMSKLNEQPTPNDMQQLRDSQINKHLDYLRAEPIQLKIWQCSRHQDQLANIGVVPKYHIKYVQNGRCVSDEDCPYCTIDILNWSLMLHNGTAGR